MLDEATITHKANQLLAELRANPDWKIDEKNFKQGYFKASRAARRSGKPTKREGKVDKQKAKTKEVRSQKKIATIKKTRQ